MTITHLIIASHSLGLRIPEPSYLPKLCNKPAFGVFVTAHRTTGIHGCIGYWNSSYKTGNNWIKEAKRVGYDAVHNDNRRHNFPRSIFTDINAYIEIQCMLLPIRRNSVDKYDPTNDGIIIQSEMNRATFLPRVFSSSRPRKQILRDLANKAGINPDSDYEYILYNTTSAVVGILDILRSPDIAGLLCNAYGQLLRSNIRRLEAPPHSRATKDDMLITDETDVVRNAGVWRDAVIWGRCKQPANLSAYPPQALAFFPRLSRIDIARLIKALPSAERKFELGEIATALGKQGATSSAEYVSAIRLIKSTPNDDIFQLNWDIQALVANGAEPITEQIMRLIKICTRADMTRWETNYLAVVWEAGRIAVYSGLLSEPLKADMEAILCEIMGLIQNRYDNGLYSFLNGSQRVDITGHIIAGWSCAFV